MFAALVCGSLGLVAAAGAFYVYLDIDKRANERALGMLQFCHHPMGPRPSCDARRRSKARCARLRPPDGRAKNRRIEITLQPNLGALGSAPGLQSSPSAASGGQSARST